MTSNLPSNWKEIEFSDVVEDSAFGPRFSGDEYADDGNIAALRTTDMSEDGRIAYENMPRARLDESRFSKHFLQVGDLVISRSGRIGTTAVFGGFAIPVLPGAFCIRFRLKSDASPFFFQYLFNSPIGQQIILSVAKGTAQQNITSTNVLKLRIPCPPPDTQQRIADILSNYDRLIDNNTRRIALLEESIHRLYKEWFVYLRFPGCEKVAIVEGVPEGWSKRPLAKYVSTQYGYTESASTEVVGPKYLRGTDINKKSHIDWSTVPYCRIDDSLQPQFELRKYDILIIRMADPGKIGIVERDINAIFASYLVRLSIKSSDLLPYYLFYFLNSDWYQGFITGASTGTTRKSASAKVMTSVDILLPPVILQQQFSQQAIVVRSQMTNLVLQNEKLREARDLLLPRLMNGSIAV